MGGVALLECYPSARTKLFEWVRLRRDSELMALNLLSVLLDRRLLCTVTSTAKVLLDLLGITVRLSSRR